MVLQQSDQEVSLQEQEESTLPQMNKQNSILSLTLDEIQCKSGVNFGSLNMDEFLASIWSSDDEATTQTLHNTENVATKQTISQPGSSNTFFVPTPISKKTVDEVWSEIHKNQPQSNEANSLVRNETLNKQQTFGEMTLEDFLVKAGIVQESRTTMPFQNLSGNVSSNRIFNGSYGFMPSMGFGFSSAQCVSSNAIGTYQMLSQNNNLGVQDCAVEKSQSVAESSNRKRIIDGSPDVVVERRQRRMLKNRESAARSRARRQAYTVELEAELNLLKEENEKLKHVLAEAERKRKQEILQRKPTTKTQKGTEKLKALRRSISASW